MREYCEKYGDAIYDITKKFGPVPKWDGAVADKIHANMCEKIPLDTLDERRRWRDVRLSGLAKLKKELGDAN